jgi:hypothetical protein
MGLVIEPHEIYFGSFLERFNIRFGPALPARQSVWHSSGITEIVALQKEFEIFREGRPFLQNAALLGLTGPLGGPANDRWLEYLLKLPGMRSDVDGVNGDERIVRAIVENLRRDTTPPLPCYMRIYDGRTREPGLVIVTEECPVFYLESVTFLTISLPMRPSPPPQARASRPRTQTGTRAPRRRKRAP